MQEAKEDAIEKIEKIESSIEDPEQRFEYGQHGFRGDGKKLRRIAFRVGLFIGQRSKLRGTYGIMISGGHREKDINGILIIEPGGGQYDEAWVEMLELFVNSVDIIFSVKNMNEIQLKGFPYGINGLMEQQIPQLDHFSKAESLD